MNQQEKSKLESRDLLKKRVVTPVQAFTTNVKYPCTGFCYFVAKHKFKIIELYNKCASDPESKEYFEFIEALIIDAGERKINNPKIHESGEYINQVDTVMIDFPEIYNQLLFEEFGTPDEESFLINHQKLYMMLMNCDIGGVVFITRSHETFIMIRCDFDNFLIVDSHNAFHGQVNAEDGAKYVLKHGTYRGLTQVGYSIIM
jgi:hypothetical protein